ncbi:hypothetical protein HZB02_02045 [Candidatus Woesearchaeota archaeon]|nr:hypothetical protein [Candidatus Woesearchaeota archaeon]
MLILEIFRKPQQGYRVVSSRKKHGAFISQMITLPSYLIARSLQLAVFRNTTLTSKDHLYLATLSDDQRKKIYEEMFRFVIDHAGRDLSL